ncbi:hypothetical protein D3C86_579530 [compost metagenome]
MSGTRLALSTPIRAETPLPTRMDQGWARGLAGAANSSTAEAPMGAISQCTSSPSPHWQSQAVPSNPTKAPRAP